MNLFVTFKKISIKSLLLVVGLILGLITQTHASAQEVRINQAFQSLLYLPLYVAQEKGFFDAQGVKVNISTGGGGAQSWAAVIGGSADFSIQDPIFVPKTRENGGEGVVVAGIQNAPTVFIIGSDDTPLQDDLAGLAGKRVITSPQPDTTWAFMSYLEKQRNLDGVRLVRVSIGNEIPALITGRADYALAVEPQVSQAIQQNGMHAVYSFSADPSWSPFAFSSLTTTQRYLDTHPDQAQGVVTGLEMASRFIYQHVDETVDIAGKYFPNLPIDIVREAVQRMIDAKGYPEHVLISREAWDNNLKIALNAGNIQAYPSDATAYENNVDTTLASRAMELLDAEAESP